MPFCPICRYEYNPEISTCPDCGETLVDTLPPDPYETDPDIKWVKIAQLRSDAYAAMINDALKAKDIPVVILSASGYFGQIGTMGISSSLPAGSGYLVMVPQEYIEDADKEGETILGDEWTGSRIYESDNES